MALSMQAYFQIYRYCRIILPHPRQKSKRKAQKSAFPQHTDPRRERTRSFYKSQFYCHLSGTRMFWRQLPLYKWGANQYNQNRTHCPARMRRGFLIGGCFIMKISRRSVLHVSGLAAAALALTGCSASGSAALGGRLPGQIGRASCRGRV